MALIFLEVVIVFTVSSLEFHQVKSPWLHRQWWVAPNSTDLSPLDYHDLWAMLQEFYHNLQPKPKTVPEF